MGTSGGFNREIGREAAHRQLSRVGILHHFFTHRGYTIR